MHSKILLLILNAAVIYATNQTSPTKLNPYETYHSYIATKQSSSINRTSNPIQPTNLNTQNYLIPQQQYTNTFRQIKTRETQIKQDQQIQPSIQPANSSYTLHQIGTLLGSIGYAHITFMVNLTTLDDNILAICKCADQVMELSMMRATCQRAKDKILDIKLMFMNHPITTPLELRRNR